MAKQPSYHSLQLFSGRLTLTLYALLLAVISFSVPLRETASVTLWAFQVIPLLLFLPGMLKKNWRTYIWLCFILLLYFLVSVLNIFSPTVLITDYVELALICSLFITAMLFCRWRQRYLKCECPAQ
ncbi:MAG: DUF2069 domain-containing protein [Pseudomonadales bacterium]|nr:DUF2069 domain-containing protein [Pseudomonadales bacterium]